MINKKEIVCVCVNNKVWRGIFFKKNQHKRRRKKWERNELFKSKKILWNEIFAINLNLCKVKKKINYKKNHVEEVISVIRLCLLSGLFMMVYTIERNSSGKYIIYKIDRDDWSFFSL